MTSDPLLVFNFSDAHLPKAPAAPVFESIPTRPPSSAQKRKMRIFHPSAREAASASVRCMSARAGLPPATISVPDKMPKKSDTITSLVTKASTIVKSGGMMPHIPKLVIMILQPDMTE